MSASARRFRFFHFIKGTYREQIYTATVTIFWDLILKATFHALPPLTKTASLLHGKVNCIGKHLAERGGFEPPIELPLCRISSAVLSTTQPPLRSVSGLHLAAVEEATRNGAECNVAHARPQAR